MVRRSFSPWSKLIVVIAVLLRNVSTFANPTHQVSTLTFTSQGITLEDLVKQASAQLKVNMRVTGDIQGDFLAVRFVNVTAADFIKKVQIATHTISYRDSDGIFFELNNEADQQLRNDFISQQTKFMDQIKESYFQEVSHGGQSEADLYKSIQTVMDFSPQPYHGDADRFESISPLRQLEYRLISGIPTSELVSIPTAGARFFSTRPTSQQYSFGTNSEDALNIFKNDQEKFLRVLAKFNSEKISKKFDDLSIPDKPDGNISTLVIAIANQTSPKITNVFGYDESGNLVFEDEFFLHAKNQDWYKNSNNPKVVLPETKEYTPIPFPKERLEFKRIFPFEVKSSVVRPLWQIPYFQEVMLHPDKHPLCAEIEGKALTLLAEKLNDNLIAEIDEKSMDSLIFFDKQGDFDVTRLMRLLKLFGKTYNIQFEIQNGWFLFTRDEPLELRPSFPNYPELASFIDKTVTTESISLDAYASYVSRCPRPPFAAFTNVNAFPSAGCSAPRSWGQAYLEALQAKIPHLKGSEISKSDWDVYGFYGSLSDSQVSQAEAGSIPLSSLSPYSLSRAKDIIYSKYLSALNPSKTVNIHQLPTVGIVGGLPGNGTFSITLTTSTVVCYHLSFGPENEARQFESPEEFSNTMAQIELNNLAEVNLLQVQSAQRRSLLLKFEFPGGLESKFQINDDVPVGSPVGSIQSLPDDLKNKILPAIEKYRKIYQNQEVGK